VENISTKAIGQAEYCRKITSSVEEFLDLRAFFAHYNELDYRETISP
jgi:hypothetical protein